MATKTSNYEFNKPEQNDFYDVDVQNENWDKVDEELSEFDDSGVTEDIKSFPDFLSKFVTGNKVAITLRNLKAGLQFVLHAGQIVNNCVTDNTGLPLSAAQGKALKDLIDTTNNNLSKAIISSDLFADYSSPTFVRWNYKTANTPYKAGLTYGQEGFALVFGSVSGWHTVISWLKGGRNMWAHYVSEGTDYGWSEYAQKSDLTGLDATLSIREENGGVIVSFGSKDSKYGIYIGVGPNGVNANYKINGEWKKAIIIATKS